MADINVGAIGEEATSQYLRSLGYTILDRNYRRPWGEIDIIARSPEGCLVFFEVKSFSGDRGAGGLDPEDNITSAKVKKMHRACISYAGSHSGLVREDQGWRIDAIAVLVPQNSSRADFRDCVIRHYKNVF
jgi:putative endonuclease